MKKVFLSVLLFFAFIPRLAFADSIESIDVVAKIQDDGSLNITQTWKATPEDGTEFYIPIQNLNHMELTNFTVSDENGPYTLVEPWNVDLSFEEKANKYGINHTNSGIELCFGKTEFKPKTYTLNFTYKNAFVGYTDLDAFNIRFINDDMSPAPDTVSVVIEKDGFNLNADNSKIWAFGYNGEIVFEDGKIIARNLESFGSSNHVTIMTAINKGIINPMSTSQDSFETLKSTAFEGSDYENDYSSFDGSSGESISTSNVFSFIPFIPIFFVFIGVFGSIISIASSYSPIAKNFKKVDKKNPQYWRDIPFEGYLPALYYMRQGELNNLDGLISAQILKWIGSSNITIDNIENDGMLKKIFKPTETVLRINDTPEFISPFEQTLFGYIQLAKGDDDILTDKEFRKFLEKKDAFPSDFSDDVIKLGKDYLLRNNYLKQDEKKKSKYYLTDKGLNEASYIYAFARFIDDFTLISEKDPVEVALWDDILIMATVLGKGEKILKEFKKFYPDYKFANSTNSGDIYVNYLFLRSFSNNSYNRAIQSAGAGGTGGAASFGGGGGFSGGGSGGGGR